MRKTTISFVMSVCPSLRPSVRMEWLFSQWRDFHEIRYLSFFKKSAKEIQVSSQAENNNGTLHEEQCTFVIMYPTILLRMRNVSDKICRENQNTDYVFLKSCRLWDNLEKYCRDGQATNDSIIWRMRIACRIPKATDTQSVYVILHFHYNNGCTKVPCIVVCRIFLPTMTLCNFPFHTRSVQLVFSILSQRQLSKLPGHFLCLRPRQTFSISLLPFI
jgi:hypothetical protein